MSTTFQILIAIASLIIFFLVIFMFMYNLRHHDDESQRMSKEINKVRGTKQAKRK